MLFTEEGEGEVANLGGGMGFEPLFGKSATTVRSGRSESLIIVSRGGGSSDRELGVLGFNRELIEALPGFPKGD